MPESGSRRPASDTTASGNIWKLNREGVAPNMRDALDLTQKLRKELSDKGLKGFKKGGKVRKTGRATVHKGEYVVKASAAKKAGPAKLAQLNRGKAKVTPKPRGRR